MSLKQLLSEGTLDPQDFDFSGKRLISDMDIHEEGIEELMEDIKIQMEPMYNEMRPSVLKVIEIVNLIENEGKYHLQFDMSQYKSMIITTLRKNQPFWDGVFKKYTKKTGVVIKMQISISERIATDTYMGIDNGQYVTGRNEAGDERETIAITINIPHFLKVIFDDNKEDIITRDILEIIDHELVHASQDVKMGRELFRKITRNAGNKTTGKIIKNMEGYIGSDLEKPAWGRTIASFFYYENNKDPEQALEKLRTLTFEEDRSSEAIINNYIKKQAGAGNKKVKDILKYAYQTLEKIKERNEQPEDVDIERL